MSKANILEVMSFAAPYAGNFLSSVKALEAQVKNSGGEISFVFPQRAREREWAKEFSSGRYVRFVDETRGAFACAGEFRSIFDERNINLVHTHFADRSLYLPLRLARLGTKIPLVYHAHSEPKGRTSGISAALKIRLIDADKLICVSDAVSLGYSALGYSCKVIHNGIDFSRLDSFEPFEHHVAGKKSILMFGYDFSIKGIDTALDAMEAELKDDFCLLLCAADYSEKAGRLLTERFGEIPDFVKVLPAREDIAAYYHAADVFLSASRTEGMSYALAEAAYCSVPIAASDIKPNLETGLPAVIFPVGNAAALADAVRKAASMSEAEIQSAKQLSQELFSMKRFADECFIELEKCIQNV